MKSINEKLKEETNTMQFLLDSNSKLGIPYPLELILTINLDKKFDDPIFHSFHLVILRKVRGYYIYE